jgi:anti-sigma-K factor RskA
MDAHEKQTCPGVEQAVGWALHALEPDEEIAVALHLPECPSCRAAVHETEEVVAGLGFAAEQVEPPAGLRAAIMNAAVETPQNVPVRTRPAEPEPVAVRAQQRPAEPPPSWMTRRRLVAASVALVAVVAVGGLAVRTVQLEQMRTQQAQSISELVGTLAPSGSRHAVLAAGDGAAMGAVVLDNGVRKLVTVGMPPNTASTTYVLWGIDGRSAPVALGTFDVTSTDAHVQSVGSMGQNDGYTAYAVSLEKGRAAPPAPSTVVAKGLLV